MDAWGALYEHCGTWAEVARLIEASPQHISYYRRKKMHPKLIWCVRVEVKTCGEIFARDLLPQAWDPDRWHEVR